MFEGDGAKGAQVIGHPGSFWVLCFFFLRLHFCRQFRVLRLFFFARFHNYIYCDLNLQSPKAVGTILRFSDELMDDTI